MFNCTAKVQGKKLIIEADLDSERGVSASGKTIIVASTEGNAPVPGKDGFQFGFNVWKPNPAHQKKAK